MKNFAADKDFCDIVLCEVYRQLGEQLYFNANISDGRVSQALGVSVEKVRLALDSLEREGKLDLQSYYYFGLSHSGILAAEDGLLAEYFSEAEHAMIERRKSDREHVIVAVYNKAESINGMVDTHSIVAELGLGDSNVICYLEEEGYVKVRSAGGWISITERGVELAHAITGELGAWS